MQILIGVISAELIIGVLELFKFQKLYSGALILTAIAFIYVGFAGANYWALGVESAQAIAFLLISYYAITKKPLLIVWGLMFHAIWDSAHLLIDFQIELPPHYELICIVVDIILAIYFYIKLKK
jgi:hypothetical protein